MKVTTVITTKDGAVVAMQERSPELIFVGQARDAMEAINAGPWLGSKDSKGFIVSKVTATQMSDWGSWWDWLLGRSKPKWIIKVCYSPKLASDDEAETK
jgi:hypothetical protein